MRRERETIELLIYGAGGFGREVAWLAKQCSSAKRLYRTVGFVDDDISKLGKVINHIPVFGIEEARNNFPEARMVLAIGPAQIREKLMLKCKRLGIEFESLIHPRAERSDFVEWGEGAVICAGNILTTNVRLGMQVQINLDCTIGHDVIMDDLCTLAPGVHVSGWVHLGKRVYVGTGAVFVNGVEGKPLSVGDDAVIGAGACVTKPVPAGTTVVGVPARPIQR